MDEPLAVKIRPKSLAEFVGQEHLVGANQPLRIAIENRQLFSFILWGPPGSGKTTLARIYAQTLNAEVTEFSAVSAGKADIRQIVTQATTKPKLLFLDEIHRFNKTQQDFLLPYVESGVITLVGATTENPSFEVIPPLLSRLRVFILHQLTAEEIGLIIDRTNIKIDQSTKLWLINLANGDARQVITILDNTLKLYGRITLENVKNTAQQKFIRYDRAGEEHYNLISAYIKSLRAGDAEAGLYYLARMIEGGEDPKFIARRMVVFASEDIGMAMPTALVVANEVFRAVETVGLPECSINLAHGTVYLAKSKKDRSAYDAYQMAKAKVIEMGNLDIPLKLRNAPTKLMKKIGYGKGYQMYDKNSLLPKELQAKK